MDDEDIPSEEWMDWDFDDPPVDMIDPDAFDCE